MNKIRSGHRIWSISCKTNLYSPEDSFFPGGYFFDDVIHDILGFSDNTFRDSIISR